MTIKAVVHPAEDGGFWAEVPALPGCFTQGDSLDEVRANLKEAIAGWFEAGEPPEKSPKRTKFWSWPFEAGLGKAVCQGDCATGLESQPHQRQPSYLTMEGRRERLVIPVHGNQPLRPGLLHSLMKMTGLTERDL